MAQDVGKDFTKVSLTCFCKQITASVDVPSSELPCRLSLCHCDTCRHHTGSLAYTAAPLPVKGSQLKVTGKPKGYVPFKSKTVERFFCDNCGTMVYEIGPDDSLIACTGALTEAEGIVKLNEQIFVGDPKDGGCSIWFPKMKAWQGWDGKSPEYDVEGTIKKSLSDLDAATEPDKLLCYCHCKGVQFTLKPASESIFPSQVSHNCKHL